MLTPQRLQEIKTLYTEWFNDLGKDTVKVATCVPELYKEVESLQSSNAKLVEENEAMRKLLLELVEYATTRRDFLGSMADRSSKRDLEWHQNSLLERREIYVNLLDKIRTALPGQ